MGPALTSTPKVSYKPVLLPSLLPSLLHPPPPSHPYPRTELQGRSQSRPNTSGVTDSCKRVKTLTDAQIIEVPSRAFEDFLSLERRERLVRFLMEAQETGGKVVVMQGRGEGGKEEHGEEEGQVVVPH